MYPISYSTYRFLLNLSWIGKIYQLLNHRVFTEYKLTTSIMVFEKIYELGTFFCFSFMPIYFLLNSTGSLTSLAMTLRKYARTFLNNLQSYGLSAQLCFCPKSFPSDQLIRVSIAGYTSNFNNINGQGSILFPKLFFPTSMIIFLPVLIIFTVDCILNDSIQ